MKRHVAVMVHALKDMVYKLAGDVYQVEFVKYTTPRVLEMVAWEFMTSKAAVANVLLCPYIQRFANDPDHERKSSFDY
ncbi:hypothetical protein N0V85_008646 [Neurospora sp. IMI 360204]|nr:hypothetical protein N0V85_008646 [Neurospora sp. IMI 360204]